MSETGKPRTLSEKLWERHLVHEAPGEHDLLYIDLHLVHEVTSPQAFDGLRMADRPVRRPDLTIATADHNVPTIQIERPIEDPISAKQLAALDTNCGEFGIRLYPMADPGQGIVHVIGPEQGLTLPGMTIVCGDSHTSTHGAFGALAFGIGTSEVEHVLATQTLPQVRPKTMAITVDGDLQPGVTAKDVILAIIGEIGTGGGIGHIIEYRGSTIRSLSMEGRMTVCNMSIEAGAKAGMIAPDDTTFAYVEGRPHAPRGAALGARRSTTGRRCRPTTAPFSITRSSSTAPRSGRMSRGAPTPDRSSRSTAPCRDPEAIADPGAREVATRALRYMGLEPGTPMRDIAVDTVFIGSCTNSRIEDLRLAASVVDGRKVAAERACDGRARFDAREGPGRGRGARSRSSRTPGSTGAPPGCSMCLGMNPDKLRPGERCASTSNRNFEGRQGKGGRTHLVSPAVAAATAIAGTFATPADLG